MGPGPPPSRGVDGSARRAQLADFLKARRAAIGPDDVGLPSSGRRRTAGLRREEVATLAGVGLSWYTWLEQGRDITPSGQVLEALSRALRLTADGRAHLFTLAGAGAATATEAPSVDPRTAAMVDALAPHPAYALDDRFDVVVHNRPAELPMGGLVCAPRPRRNLLLWLFAGRDTWSPDLQSTWAATARANLLDFRTSYAAHVGEPAFEDLVAQLSETGPTFRDWWAEHDVAALEPTRKSMPHPELGPLELDLLPSTWGALRLRILVPADDRTRQIFAERFG